MNLRSIKHSEMDDTDNGDNAICMAIREALKSPREQAIASFNILNEKVNEYTNARFYNDTKEVINMWRMHVLNLSHPYRDVLERNFTQEPDAERFAHIKDKIITKELIKTELENIYLTLKTLKEVFEHIMADHSDNHLKYAHDFPKIDTMDEYLKVARDQIYYNLAETESAMTILKIDRPKFDATRITYNRTAQAKEWLMIAEHLSFTQYLRHLYTILLGKCNV